MVCLLQYRDERAISTRPTAGGQSRARDWMATRRDASHPDRRGLGCPGPEPSRHRLRPVDPRIVRLVTSLGGQVNPIPRHPKRKYFSRPRPDARRRFVFPRRPFGQPASRPLPARLQLQAGPAEKGDSFLRDSPVSNVAGNGGISGPDTNPDRHQAHRMRNSMCPF